MTALAGLQARWTRLHHGARGLFPGIVVCLTVAAAAQFLANHYGAPRMLFALLLGMALHFLNDDSVCQPGFEAATGYVLRTGVALLGVRITFEAVLSLGAGAVALVAAGTLLTIACGVLVARLAGYPTTFGLLTGGAVGICGASAALAIAAVLPENRKGAQDTVFAVIAVTTLSTLAMIFYPVAAEALGLGDGSTGLFLGGTIHDVAQVVGAGYSVSTDAGDTATITKLVRVAMLVPVVFTMSLAFGERSDGRPAWPLPPFVLGFCGLVAVNSAGWIPGSVANLLETMSSWFLVAAIAGLGIKTSLGQLGRLGAGPVALVVTESLFLAGWVLGGVGWLV